MSLEILQAQSEVSPDGQMGKNTFNAAAKQLGITSRFRAIHFFAQCEHETGHFKTFVENLNYSARGLRTTWPNRFNEATSIEYMRQPERIANKVYADRIGNGDEASGDGWLFRGGGAIQLTGRFNVQKFSVYVNDHTLLKNPEPISGKYAFNSAMFFFRENNIWELCDLGIDDDTVKKVTKAINGGYKGLEERIELTRKYSKYKWEA